MLLITWCTDTDKATDPRIEVLGYGDIENAKDHQHRELAKTQIYYIAYNAGFDDGKQTGIDETLECLKLEKQRD